ncbi:hypothetical protein L9F63_011130 [Diploptera punctata]|uniref:Tetraspanin n=1 Tax=Diploptera punctata TaxID=6984 RepID=A0AAD8AFR3_DIPPU|nr:hypothetical protein L9F63_011130 [Diploptera punctata]
MGLSGGEACIKYLLFAFNLIFVLTGISTIVVGAIIPALYHDYRPVLQDGFFSIPYLLIAIGVIVFIVSFFGCCGAIKENHCMVMLFSVLLIIIFVMELAGGIAAYVLKDQTADSLGHQLNRTSHDFGRNQEYTTFWNVMQSELHCCGVDSYHDWMSVFHNNTLPQTCCKGNMEMNCTTASLKIYGIGCIQGLAEFLKNRAVALGASAIAIALIQVFGIILSCKLATYIRQNNYV